MRESKILKQLSKISDFDTETYSELIDEVEVKNFVIPQLLNCGLTKKEANDFNIDVLFTMINDAILKLGKNDLFPEIGDTISISGNGAFDESVLKKHNMVNDFIFRVEFIENTKTEVDLDYNSPKGFFEEKLAENKIKPYYIYIKSKIRIHVIYDGHELDKGQWPIR